jgi:hypothetical protein
MELSVVHDSRIVGVSILGCDGESECRGEEGDGGRRIGEAKAGPDMCVCVHATKLARPASRSA